MPPGLKVENTGIGDGIIGIGDGVGVSGSGQTGVIGSSNAGSGIYGNSTSGSGVEAESLSADGVFATSTKSAGVYAESIYYAGIEGFAPLKPGVRGGSQDGPGMLGDSDRGVGVFGINRVGPPYGQGVGIYGTAPAAGVRGESPSIGVQGTSKNYAGVAGNGPVYGTTGTSAAGTGVYGASTNGAGVYGASQNGAGAYGASTKSDGVYGAGNTSGVRGDSANGVGVDGVSFLNQGVRGTTLGTQASVGLKLAAGVKGVSMTDTFGVYGISWGAKIGPGPRGSLGIVGAGVFADALNGTALVARAPLETGVAGVFEGHVLVAGDFVVFLPPGKVKSSAVPHPDGSYRRFYSLESAESFFEDFGRARLTRGLAKVRLARDFAALVRRDDYFVFLAPEGPTPGVYVSRRTREGFEVREYGNGTGTLTFAYRVVARPRGLQARRLEKVAVPRFEGPKISRREVERVKISKPPEVPERLRAPKPIEPPEVAPLPRRQRRTGAALRSRRRGHRSSGRSARK